MRNDRSKTHYASSKKGRNSKVTSNSKAANKEGTSEVIPARKDIPNNPNWYYHNSELAKQAAQFSFNQFVGDGLRVPGYNTLAMGNIAVYYLNPTAGSAITNASQALDNGINAASYKLYSSMSAYTGRTVSYGPQDLAILELALGEIISQTEWFRRLFGIVGLYSKRNRTIPVQLIHAIGVDYDDFAANLSSYRTQINTLISIVQSVPFPANIPYFDKCAEIYRHVFADSNQAMSQLYISSLFQTWQLNETYDDNGSGLDSVGWGNDTSATDTTKKLSYYIDKFKSCVYALLNSSSLNVMYADILNWANKKSAPLYTISIIDEDYAIVPEYNETFLMMIGNAHIVGATDIDATKISSGMTKYNDVSCNANDNTLRYNPAIKVGTATSLSNAQYLSKNSAVHVLNFTTEDVKEDWLIDCMAYQSASEQGIGGVFINGEDVYTRNTTMMDHIISRVKVYGVQSSEDGSVSSTVLWWTSSNIILGSNIIVPYVINCFSAFPRIYAAKTATSDVLYGCLQDLDTYTTISNNTVKNLIKLMDFGLYEVTDL